MDRVFRQSGHMKQFRAHLKLSWFYTINNAAKQLPVLFCTYTRTGDFEKTIWTIVGTDFNRNTSITPHRVAFFTEEECMERVKAIRWWRKMRWWWYWRNRETRAVVLDAWTCHYVRWQEVNPRDIREPLTKVRMNHFWDTMAEPDSNTLPLQSSTITRGVVPAVSFADVLEDLGKHDGLSRLGNTPTTTN